MRGEFPFQVSHIIRRHLRTQDFLDDRKKIVERADWRERLKRRIAKTTTGHGQQQRGFDHFPGDSTQAPAGDHTGWRLRECEAMPGRGGATDGSKRTQHPSFPALRFGAVLASFAASRSFLFAFAYAKATPFNHGDLGVMSEPVQKRGDAGGVGEDLVPVSKGAI